MTVLLESIDIFIVLLKGGTVCIHHYMNNLMIITAIMCIGLCSLHCLFLYRIIKNL